jgi:hypothetical protein
MRLGTVEPAKVNFVDFGFNESTLALDKTVRATANWLTDSMLRAFK